MIFVPLIFISLFVSTVLTVAISFVAVSALVGRMAGVLAYLADNSCTLDKRGIRGLGGCSLSIEIVGVGLVVGLDQPDCVDPLEVLLEFQRTC